MQVTDFGNNTAQSETARIVVTSVPVGGYSVSFDKHAIAEPLTVAVGLALVSGISFVAFKRKIKRRN